MDQEEGAERAGTRRNSPAHVIDSGAHWYSGLTIQERCTALRNTTSFIASYNVDDKQHHRWITTPAFRTKDLWLNFLECHKVSEREFLLAVSLDPRDLARHAGGAPDWLQKIQRLLNESIEPGESETEAFLAVVAPLMSAAVENVRIASRTLHGESPHAPSCTKIVTALAQDLRFRLLAILTKPLVLEMNIARVSGMLSGTRCRWQ